MSKLIVIVGITGNQGASVASSFLAETGWKIRGITRNASSSTAKSLAGQGIEIVEADIDSPSTLIPAFAGANVIFGNTIWPAEFSTPPSQATFVKPGQTLREWCFEKEVQQGKNIVDAVAAVGDSLELFIWSSLSDATKWSNGKYKGIYHFDSKATVAEYAHEKWENEVGKKMSLLQMGLFITNWKFGPIGADWQKRPDGSMLLRMPGKGSFPVPLVVPSDAGSFALALTKVPPGKNLIAYGDLIPWSEYVKLWSKITGVPAEFEHSTVESLDKAIPGGIGEEFGEMQAYAQEYGYWGGGDKSVVFPEDLGVDIPRTRIAEYIEEEDWSELLSLPVTGS